MLCLPTYCCRTEGRKRSQSASSVRGRSKRRRARVRAAPETADSHGSPPTPSFSQQPHSLRTSSQGDVKRPHFQQLPHQRLELDSPGILKFYLKHTRFS